MQETLHKQETKCAQTKNSLQQLLTSLFCHTRCTRMTFADFFFKNTGQHIKQCTNETRQKFLNNSVKLFLWSSYGWRSVSNVV